MANDLVYILGKSSNGNFDIKYSVRSAEMYLKNLRDIYIIGDKPEFFNDNVIEIKHKDIYTNKARNIMAKILRACNEKSVSQNFMLFNDDYFLLKSIDATNYPYYYKSDLHHSVKVNIGEYSKHCLTTLIELEKLGSNILNFDTHDPIIYNKAIYKKTVEQLNWEIPFGYISKSIYCNLNGIQGLYKQDCKISHPYTLSRILDLNQGREMFSTSESAMNLAMKKYIKSLYPEKSSFEL